MSSYLTFPPLPDESQAVYLCCTCPEVAFGGRYPLSLPFGARTFLTKQPFGLLARLSNLLARLILQDLARFVNQPPEEKANPLEKQALEGTRGWHFKGESFPGIWAADAKLGGVQG